MNHLLKEFAKESQDKTPMPDGLVAQQADSEAMGRETGALCCRAEGPLPACSPVSSGEAERPLLLGAVLTRTEPREPCEHQDVRAREQTPVF